MAGVLSRIVPVLIGAGIILLLTLLTGGSLRGRKAEQRSPCEGCACGGGECAKAAEKAEEG
ncbi:MAG TPA: hypothetical protein VLA21_03630 [Candidatus Limnocylindria bacterium]|nr:hypothetical protein [Candidatus Limnocylindria bacterium]